MVYCLESPDLPAGTHIMRFLPPLNLQQREAEEGLKTLESVVAGFAG